MAAQPDVGHPHIADLAPGYAIPADRISPLLNRADGKWNNGESTLGADMGGVLGNPPLPGTHVPTILPVFPVDPVTGRWRGHPSALATMWHYRGQLQRPGGNQSGDDPLAAFEIVAPPPSAMSPSGEVVVALFTPATFGSPVSNGREQFNPHDYPGWVENDGLLSPGNDGTHVDIVARNLGQAEPFRAVGVVFAPRTSNRPIVFTMQRLREVRLAVRHLLSQPPYSLDPNKIAYLVTGASFGGYTSYLAPIYYPNEFHAALSSAYNGAHRSMPSDFDSLVFFTSLLGSDFAGHSYTLRDTVEIPMWCKLEGTDFASASFTNRWVAGHVQRPTYFLVADEDLVTHGTDWMRVLAEGTSQQPPAYLQIQSGHYTRNGVDVYFSVVPKSCHGGDRFDAFRLEGVTNPHLTTDLLEPFDVMLRAAHNERLLGRSIQSIDILGRKLPSQSGLPSLDPSLPALSHGDARTTRSTYNKGTHPNLLVESPTFRRTGQGTWLGANESLKVKTLPGEPRASIFVGSADGYVTRLQMQVINGKKPLVELARSRVTESGQVYPYVLGHGTWGLDVADLDPASTGLEVVVAAYDRIAVFRASDLELLRVKSLPPQPAAPNWEYSSPRRLQIAELDGQSPGQEIVFRTLHNHLVIMDKDLNIRFEHHEGGIVDLAIGPAPTPMANNPLAAPIYLLSARGHVARLEIDRLGSQGQTGRLAGVSTLQYGAMRDLDVVTYQGQPSLAGLFYPHPTGQKALRFFAPTDCTQIGALADLHTPPPPPETGENPETVQHGDVAGDMVPSFTEVAGHGGSRYVISAGGDLSVWADDVPLGIKALASFVPAGGHGTVEAGDVDEALSGEEVVVATTAGRVIWFALDELEGFTKEFAFPREFTTAPGPGGVITYEHRCNMSLGGASAIARAQVGGPALDVVDQVGTWWRVDPMTGNPTYVRELPGGAMHLVSSGASSVADKVSAPTTLPHRAWLSASFGLASSPYVPDLRPNRPTGAWWVPSGEWLAATLHFDGQWAFPAGGSGPAAYLDAATGTRWCAWWHRYGTYPQLIQRARYDVLGGQMSVLDVWGSTGPLLASGQAPARVVPGGPGYHRPLRTELAVLAPMSFQAVRVGKVLIGKPTPQVIATGLGARVMVLDGDTGLVIETAPGSLQYVESPDYGVGGLALAVADLTGDGYDEILFSPLYNPIASGGGTVRSYLHVLTSNPAGNGLVELSNTLVGEAGTSAFLGYGTSAIAVDVIPVGGNPRQIVVVGTLNGELAVFGHNQGVIDTNALFRTIVDGSLGGFGSILIDDIQGDGSKEVYVGGSAGLRRFDVQ